jgi:hypothetical protein
LAVQIYIAERYSLTRCAQLTRRKGLAERGQVGVRGRSSWRINRATRKCGDDTATKGGKLQD